MILIDADALNPKFVHGRWDDRYVSEKEVQAAPTIDAVQVVHCKDCEYFKEIDQFFGECTHLPNGLINDLFWFCADGERRTDDSK